MFYPIDLLHHQRSKWTPCWLAAIHDERFFKRRYQSNAIKKINIENICEDIVEILQTRSSTSFRFSLYLSSQLMYGTIKLYYYQVKYYQKEVFDIERIIHIKDFSKKAEPTFDEVNYLENAAIEATINLNFNKDLHLLSDENLNFRLQTNISEEYQNFGDLTDEDLQNLQDSQKMKKLFLEGMIRRKADIHQEEDGTEIAREFLEISVSLTPQKRQPRELLEDTPTKRRRLSLETVLPILQDQETVPTMEPIPDLSVEKLPVDKTATLPLPQMETELELEPSHFIIKKRPKKCKIIDKTIILNSDTLWKNRSNINFASQPLQRPYPYRLSQLWITGKRFFEQPSHFPEQWNTRLRNLFDDRITGPFTTTTDEASSELVSFSGILRAEETDNANVVSQMATLGLTDLANTVEQVEIVNIPSEKIIHETAAVSVLEEMPHTVAFEEDIKTTKVLLTVREILTMLETLWENKEIIDFNELIPELSTYTKMDAAFVFEVLLDFHTREIVILQQVDFSQSLKILKYKD